LVYEQATGEPRVSFGHFVTFTTRPVDKTYDETIVTAWAGPTSYGKRDVRLGRYEWTEQWITMGPPTRVPPWFRLDAMDEPSPFATPKASHALFPNAELHSLSSFRAVVDGLARRAQQQLQMANA